MRAHSQIRSWSYAVLVLCLVILLAGSAVISLAQAANSGTIVGSVTDASGAIVQNAKITITDAATGEARSTTTNDAGHYVIPNVNPGQYDVAVSKQGFSVTKTMRPRV